jgi:hypothetical protein
MHPGGPDPAYGVSQSMGNIHIGDQESLS